MSSLLSELSLFVEESNIGLVPWKAALDNLAAPDLMANDDVITQGNRPFYYLKSLKGLPSYAEDFGNSGAVT